MFTSNVSRTGYDTLERLLARFVVIPLDSLHVCFINSVYSENPKMSNTELVSSFVATTISTLFYYFRFLLVVFLWLAWVPFVTSFQWKSMLDPDCYARRRELYQPQQNRQPILSIISEALLDYLNIKPPGLIEVIKDFELRVDWNFYIKYFVLT
jgi:hypothetical protein